MSTTPLTLVQRWQIARKRSVPLLAIQTPDPGATVDWIQTASPNQAPPIVRWDAAQGLQGVNRLGTQRLTEAAGVTDDLQLLQATVDPVNALRLVHRLPDHTIACFLNLHRYLQQADVVQAVWNCRDVFKRNFRTLVLLSPSFEAPLELVHDILIWEEPYPTDEEMLRITRRLYEAAQRALPEAEGLRRIFDALRGLPAFSIEQALALSLTARDLDFEQLWQQKVQFIRSTHGLSFSTGRETFADIGGLDQAKRAMALRFQGPQPPKVIVRIEEIDRATAGASKGGGTDSSGVAQDAMQVLLTALEDEGWDGMLCLGPAGTGKTYFSKAVGPTFGCPTLTADLGATRSKYVGDSEANVRGMVRAIKAIAGPDAFVIASVNSVETMDPALIRRFRAGRWFFDLCTPEERPPIWTIQRARYRIPEDEPLPPDERFTGADIRNVCEQAHKLGVTLIQATEYTVPVALADPDGMRRLQEAAHLRFLSASYPGPYQKPGPAAQGRGLQVGDPGLMADLREMRKREES